MSKHILLNHAPCLPCNMSPPSCLERSLRVGRARSVSASPTPPGTGTPPALGQRLLCCLVSDPGSPGDQWPLPLMPESRTSLFPCWFYRQRAHSVSGAPFPRQALSQMLENAEVNKVQPCRPRDMPLPTPPPQQTGNDTPTPPAPQGLSSLASTSTLSSCFPRIGVLLSVS